MNGYIQITCAVPEDAEELLEYLKVILPPVLRFFENLVHTLEKSRYTMPWGVVCDVFQHNVRKKQKQ